MAMARTAINRIAGSRRMLAHSLFTPKKAGWLDEVDRAIAQLKPDSWKGYTVGDPLFLSTKGSYWRLDDEKLMYPFYEKIVKTDIRTICIHKGLLPADYEKSWPDVWQYTTVWDLGKAAKDWPQLNFVIYHGALRPFQEDPKDALAEFEQTGRMKWATDLAEIPAKYGVSNVYGEIGTAFATCAVSNPRFAAAFMGTLIKGLGVDHVVCGSDSLWYGSPQWQIEALRRLEIPEDMRRKHGFAPLGPADGVVKTAILGGNSARMYDVHIKAALGEINATTSPRSSPSTWPWAGCAPTPATATCTGPPPPSSLAVSPPGAEGHHRPGPLYAVPRMRSGSCPAGSAFTLPSPSAIVRARHAEPLERRRRRRAGRAGPASLRLASGGADTSLVVLGGGNTSIKTVERDHRGREQRAAGQGLGLRPQVDPAPGLPRRAHGRRARPARTRRHG